MDPLQERLAHIALHVIGERGFVLGGGHAIELHRMSTRPSEDIDLFSAERGSPGAVADDVLNAYRGEGLEVTVRLRTADLVQLQVTDAQAGSCMVDLGMFWRARSPVLMEIGPVLEFRGPPTAPPPPTTASRIPPPAGLGQCANLDKRPAARTHH